MVYTEDGQLSSLLTLFEAHQSAERMRMKISQVLVLPPYQRRGIASRMYEAVFNHYRLKEPKCFEVLVEDAADEF